MERRREGSGNIGGVAKRPASARAGAMQYEPDGPGRARLSRPMKPPGLVLVGCGAIGGAVLERLQSLQAVQVVGVVARVAGHASSVETLRRLGFEAPVVGAIDELDGGRTCASNAPAIRRLQLTWFRRCATGFPASSTSVGALAADAVAE